MKIIEPSFRLSTPFSDNLTREDGIRMLRFIEAQARISHRAEDRQTEDSWERFIKSVVIDHGDMSVIEHVSVTATLRTDRGVLFELTRHRLFSFTCESTRFVNGKKSYPEGLEFVMPAELDKGSWHWEQAVSNSEREYLDMLECGARPQEARAVLPNSLACTIAVTGNLRTWRAFFLSRVSREAHPDFKRLTIPMLEKFKELFPIIFDDIEDGLRQVDLARKPR